ncbi:Hsp20/alpha crystallin family protein [Lewinella lacunae]|uniref:Hsp20/alpha crystallin family protein n=2 Tax=Neolewinella lacunae TaxID=1517758 RepID=A0A923PKL4_9BACT|nr:Hsp20/alpha crystallin family protein [Neolewinella lacunae]MBC6995775.1 Hsp20/alpha crystallin family protein [Neolewinella lacunae]
MHSSEGGRGRGHRRPHYGPRRPKHNVPVNILYTDTGFEAHVFCVGFAKENIRINLTNDLIYISGTRKPEEEYPDFLLQEYPVKSFERWFELSEKVDQAGITAAFRDGILVITAPWLPTAQPPEREVKVE